MKHNLIFPAFFYESIFPRRPLFVNYLFLISLFFSGSCGAMPNVNNFHEVLSQKSLKVLRDTGFSHWELRDAIYCTSADGHYAWLEDYHRIQEERSKPTWRQQVSSGPLPDLPSGQERDAKEKELVLAVLSLLKEKAKKEADQEEKRWEEGEVASKNSKKCWWITAAILSVGAIISGVVPCAHK